MRLLCVLCGFSLLSGCAQVIVTKDASGKTTSVKVEPMAGLPIGNKAKVPNVATQSRSITQMEAATHKGINQHRQKHKLKPLVMDSTLSRVAREYSRRMSREKFFSHYDKQGKSAADRVRAAGKNYRAVGENLFMSTNVPNPVNAAVEGWMKSKGHRANILTEAFTHTGIGVWKHGNTYHFTQIFMRPV